MRDLKTDRHHAKMTFRIATNCVEWKKLCWDPQLEPLFSILHSFLFLSLAFPLFSLIFQHFPPSLPFLFPLASLLYNGVQSTVSERFEITDARSGENLCILEPKLWLSYEVTPSRGCVEWQISGLIRKFDADAGWWMPYIFTGVCTFGRLTGHCTCQCSSHVTVQYSCSLFLSGSIFSLSAAAGNHNDTRGMLSGASSILVTLSYTVKCVSIVEAFDRFWNQMSYDCTNSLTSRHGRAVTEGLSRHARDLARHTRWLQWLSFKNESGASWILFDQWQQ